jgi:hypothetical protein
MHHRLLVTTRNGASAIDACASVERGLVAQGFVGPFDDPAYRFARGIADWVEIGGRWANLLDGNAERLTAELYDRFLLEYEGVTADYDGFVDLEEEQLSREFIGRKWLVVVDYHT